MHATRRFASALLASSILVAVTATVLLAGSLPAAAAAGAPAATGAAADAWTWGLVAAAASTALAALGAGFAVARVGTAAIGALAEKPELFGRLLIFVGLAEGIAIYGLIVSILILNRLG